MAKRVTPLFAVVAMGLGGGTAAAETVPTTPRTLPSGSPACGNAQVKAMRGTPCIEVPRAATCMTVLDQVDSNRDHPAYRSCVRGDEPAQLIANKVAVSRVLKLFGITMKIAPVEPRVLRTGAPANGNVARRR